MSCKRRGLRAFLCFSAVTVICLLFLGMGRMGVPYAETAGKPADGVFHVLLLGEDQASGLCDVIMLATVDAEAGRVSLMQIPRDTYFRYTKKNYKKINGAVETLGGAEAFCELLGNTLAMDIHGYVKVDLDCVRSAVDALGGVEIDVPCDMDYEDPAQGLSIHLKKGRQRLDGEQSVQFVRFRSGYLRGDIGRIDAQKLFLAALFQAAQSTRTEDIPRLAALSVRSAHTNIGLSRMISLFRLARTVRAENVTLVTLPGEEVRSEYSGAWYYVASRSGVAAVLETCFGVEGASSAIDPGHLFSDVSRRDFEDVYRREILPEYYTVDALQARGLSDGSE